MAWCKGVHDTLDWQQVLRLAKTECTFDAGDDDLLRIGCTAKGLGAALDAVRGLLESSKERHIVCANGLIFLLSVVLAYAREGLSPIEVSRAQVLLWKALQENFMLDASVWPVKTHDVLHMFDRLPPPLPFPSLTGKKSPQINDLVTLVVPRCPPELIDELESRFPGMSALIGLTEEASPSRKSVPNHWTAYEDGRDMSTGFALNRMLEAIETPLTLVVTGGVLPQSLKDLERLVRALESRRLVAAAGPLVGEDKVYSDFCYRLKLRHYHLGFDPVYDHSVIFDEESASSVRGSWFHEYGTEAKDGPCKLCETLPPTFLGRTASLRAIGFNAALDGDFAILDFSIRAAKTPLVEVKTKDGPAPIDESRPGLRYAGGRFALCPFVATNEVSGLGGPHLYGRSDMPTNGVAPSSVWFGDDTAALGKAGSASTQNPGLVPSKQAQLFAHHNNLKEYTGPEGIKRYFGCNLEVTNCPVPDWVYRGWAIPPCCKETMRHLLFYIDGVFRELGVRYIVTDGVLLGSYKFGRMLDWDADVDLHIHNDDFHLLEEKVQHRARADGHHLRKHANNRSWLLQANDHNYLLIELNLRQEFWDPAKVWQVPIQGRLFPAMEEAHLNLSSWYGLSFFKHRLRHVPEWEEEHRPMFCSTPYHFNCVDETTQTPGRDCRSDGIC
eukprot:TRINITY_DN35635_c0_g1_i1.p1 TRINITY_DN35635_c0_g1~~TRINITY_DN35635_c0_g1_i1.p1  ORF type:complete len:734 (-),score=111.46 TRINITY_DN35635_c0_g1_i1:240-2246(-)